MKRSNLPKWSHFEKIHEKFAFLLATGFGSGLSPFAPGTFGSLAVLPIVWVSLQWEASIRLIFWFALFALGCWAAGVFDEVEESSDHSSIVIDEWIGMAIATLTLEAHSYELIAVAFILFRLFDIRKFPPVRQIDRWSKKVGSSGSPRSIRGFGVMADDLVAGAQALILVILIQIQISQNSQLSIS